MTAPAGRRNSMWELRAVSVLPRPPSVELLNVGVGTRSIYLLYCSTVTLSDSDSIMALSLLTGSLITSGTAELHLLRMRTTCLSPTQWGGISTYYVPMRWNLCVLPPKTI